MKISAAIITFNEEDKIKRCIESLKGIVDEIIVVDSHSTDKTQEIAKDQGAVIFEQKFLGHVQQKNLAIEKTNHEWVLSLDADEALSEDLKDSLKQLKNSPLDHKAYGFNRKTHYVERWIHHCGWYPDKKVRLFHKSFAKWAGQNPHDIIEVRSGESTHWLKGDLLHYSYDSISDHIDQTNRFTTIAAKEAYARGKRSSFLGPFFRAGLKFLRDYFFKRGFLDGRYGLVICTINSLSAFLKYMKIYEIEKNRFID
ncbi:MAG: glycosyltransferase family 2 protein [Bacteriovoracaceae bacterium]